MALTGNFGQASYFQVPPDSTGKKLSSIRHAHVEYNSGTADIFIGDTIVGNTSGTTGVVSEVKSTNTTSTGELIVVFSRENYSDGFTVGEVLSVDGQNKASVATVDYFYSQTNSIVGANNPHNSLFIDNKGSAYIRFSEGEQQLDAFGLSRTSTPTLIGEYTFFYDDDQINFQDILVGAGSSVSHVPAQSSVELTTDGNSGDKAIRTTNRYHLYQPGFSQIILMTGSIGDTGKTNVDRCWGYFDDNDGLFFQLAGTQLNVVQRSSVSGTPVDTVVSQADWNGDVVDGSGSLSNLSRFNLDVSKNNIYWIDIEWLGAGRTRFGCYDSSGNRITFHSFENANTVSYPYMKTPTLPLRWQQINTGFVGSSSTMKMTCAAVCTEGNLVPDRKKKTIKRSCETATQTIGNTETAILSIRATDLINGIVNRKIVVPELYSLLIKNNPIILRFYRGTTLTAPVWTKPDADSAAEYDISASAFNTSNARVMMTMYYNPGTYEDDMPPNWGIQGEHLKLLADGTNGDMYTVTAECEVSGQTSDVRYSLSFIDVG